MLFSFSSLILEILEYQGVSIGGGIGSISDIVEAAQLICEKVRPLCRLCIIFSGITDF